MVCFAIASVPTGTSGDVVVTHSSWTTRCSIATYRAVGLKSATPSQLLTSTANDPTCALDIPANGFAIGATAARGTSSSSWSGLTEDFDTVSESAYSLSSASKKFSSAQTDMTITCDFSSPSYSSGVFASWESSLAVNSYSESTIKTQGSYALKAVAAQTDSLNKTLTKTFSTNHNLTGVKNLRFDAYALRTGGQWKLGLHDTGGTTTEITPTIAISNTWQPVNWDLSGVSDANKDAIDTLILTIINADSANTLYLDYAEIAQAIDVFGWVS
jgi:hypothetical protein